MITDGTTRNWEAMAITYSEFNKLNVVNGVNVSGLRKRDGPGASHTRAITRRG